MRSVCNYMYINVLRECFSYSESIAHDTIEPISSLKEDVFQNLDKERVLSLSFGD